MVDEVMTEQESLIRIDMLTRELEAANGALRLANSALKLIAAWPFDIMGDCVAEARYVASHPAHPSVLEFMRSVEAI